MIFFSYEISWLFIGGKECKFCGGGWCKCECVGRQKGLCESCLIRVTSMHYIKSIRMFEDDVTWSKHALVNQGGSLWGLCWWRDVYSLKNVLPSLGCHSILIKALPSAFFSCALTVNVIDLLVLC
jgi:hypothetical protein